MKKEAIYMTVKVPCQAWDKTPQVYLGKMVWSEAVKIAKQQTNEVRLCTYSGYGTQGHYIQPDKYYTDPNAIQS